MQSYTIHALNLLDFRALDRLLGRGDVGERLWGWDWHGTGRRRDEKGGVEDLIDR
jgi:hypothetical protein